MRFVQDRSTARRGRQRPAAAWITLGTVVSTAALAAVAVANAWTLTSVSPTSRPPRSSARAFHQRHEACRKASSYVAEGAGIHPSCIHRSARRLASSRLLDDERFGVSSVTNPSLLDDDDDCSIRDSFNLVVLGDLHLEDDMSHHNQARDDCLYHLSALSLLPTSRHAPLPITSSVPSAASKSRTISEILPEIQARRAGDLTAPQLELLLAHKMTRRHGGGGDENGNSMSTGDGDVGSTLLNSFLVSLGDLGRKDIRHEPGDAGTSACFQQAKEYLDSFGLPYELVTGNHDLEGLDEFPTDEQNLMAFLDCFDKPTPQFCKRVGDRTLLVGLSTVRFRSSPHSSHEVYVDGGQIEWFLDVVKSHPHHEGWKILVFTHAPIAGSGLRVLQVTRQTIHVQNGCAWVNHGDASTRNLWIRTVLDNPQIKLWFSGHFHLSHDFEDSISVVGSCVFVQAGVVGPSSTRDGKRQTRIVQGNGRKMQIYTVNHHVRDDDGRAALRLDADIDTVTGDVTFAHGGAGSPRALLAQATDDDGDDADWFQAYSPAAEDGCYIEAPDGSIADAESIGSKVCWWHMADGAVLGLHQSQLVEYDAETLSPLGVVVNRNELDGREVVVVANGTVLVLVDEASKGYEIIHPNEDGSYWRKFQRNKAVRQSEKAREAIARMWLEQKDATILK